MGREKTKGDLHTHFKRRIAQRFSMTVDNSDIELVIERIQNGQSKPVKTISNRITNHLVLVPAFSMERMERVEEKLIVGYDSRRKALVTVLFPENGG